MQALSVRTGFKNISFECNNSEQAKRPLFILLASCTIHTARHLVCQYVSEVALRAFTNKANHRNLFIVLGTPPGA